MTKKELKDKVIWIYQKAYHTDKTPDVWDITCLVNITAGIVRHHSQAEREFSKEYCDLVKKYTSIKKGEVEVKITELLNEIGWFDEE